MNGMDPFIEGAYMRLTNHPIYVLANPVRNIVISVYTTEKEAKDHFDACDHKDQLAIKVLHSRFFEDYIEDSKVLQEDC